MDNKTLILGKFNEHKGEFVITDYGWKVERLVAIGEDDIDYYYITYDGRKFTWHTCVGQYICLKGKIDEKDYQKFVRIAELNAFDQLKWHNLASETRALAIQEHKTELMTLKAPNKFLTEVCWDIN